LGVLQQREAALQHALWVHRVQRGLAQVKPLTLALQALSHRALVTLPHVIQSLLAMA
jgi:hypothetical protein